MSISFNPIQPITSNEQEEEDDYETDEEYESEHEEQETIVAAPVEEPKLISKTESTTTTVSQPSTSFARPPTPQVKRPLENLELVPSVKKMKPLIEEEEICKVTPLSKNVMRKRAMQEIMMKQGYTKNIIDMVLGCEDEEQVTDLLKRLLYVENNCQEQRSLSDALIATSKVLEAIASRMGYSLRIQDPLSIALKNYMSKRQIKVQLNASDEIGLSTLTKPSSDTTLPDIYTILMGLCAEIIITDNQPT